jgi:hypothetical protein
MTIALVSGQTANSSPIYSGASVTATLPHAPTQGNLVIVCLSWADNGTGATPGTITVKDGNSNAYTPTTSSPYEDLAWH